MPPNLVHFQKIYLSLVKKKKFTVIFIYVSCAAIKAVIHWKKSNEFEVKIKKKFFFQLYHLYYPSVFSVIRISLRVVSFELYFFLCHSCLIFFSLANFHFIQSRIFACNLKILPTIRIHT